MDPGHFLRDATNKEALLPCPTLMLQFVDVAHAWQNFPAVIYCLFRLNSITLGKIIYRGYEKFPIRITAMNVQEPICLLPVK